jgi:hypothetical protein
MKTDSTNTDSAAGADSLDRLVLPRRETPRHSILSKHLEVIQECLEAAIHKGFVERNAKTLNATLEAIIIHAQAAKGMIRKNTQSEAQPPAKKL